VEAVSGCKPNFEATCKHASFEASKAIMIQVEVFRVVTPYSVVV
jgi:hypothetical protein